MVQGAGLAPREFLINQAAPPALSAHPALRSIGMTSGIGVLLAFLMAPSALLLSPSQPGGRG